jgi:hypothetical protein
MLWQYYGGITGRQGAKRIAKDIGQSDRQFGIRGARVSSFAVLEGEGCHLFIRMALRAGSLFDETEARAIKSEVCKELIEAEQKKNPQATPIAVTNDNPLAIWLNYLLYHLSLTNPGRERAARIDPDPFTLSLLALERLLTERAIGKADRSTRKLAEINFRVAMSFPGEHRTYVAAVVGELRPHLGPDSIFYDHDYQAQLARPNLDVLLQNIYRNRSALVVVFLCEKYAEKEWCGLEWRAIKDMLKSKQSDQLMFVRFDNAPIDGLFSTDGYVDAQHFSPAEVAKFVLTRLRELPPSVDA